MTLAHVAFMSDPYLAARAWQAGPAHDGAGGGVGTAGPLTHAKSTLLLCWHPAATSFAVLNQHAPPDSTPAAQPAFAWHSEQHISLVAAGAESRLPCPRSQFGVKVHVLARTAIVSVSVMTAERIFYA